MGGHDGSADLAQAYAVAPAVSAEDDFIVRHFHIEPGTVQVAFGEEAPDHQFFADGQCSLGADNAQLLDAAGTAPFEGFQGNEVANFHARTLRDEGGEIRAPVPDGPVVEVFRLKVVVVEDLAEDSLVMGVAPGVVMDSQVWIVLICPGRGEAFRAAAAALVEAGVHEFPTGAEGEAPGFVDGGADFLPYRQGEALVTLAVVIGTDVETVVVVMVEPFDDLARRLTGFRRRPGRLQPGHEGRDIVEGIRHRGFLFSLPVGDLRHHPGPGDDRMGLQELRRGGGLHLGGDDAEEVVLDADDIDSHHLPFVHDELEGAGELLVLLPLPMEVHADGHPVQDERRLGEESGDGGRLEDEFIVEGAVIVDFTFPVGDLLRAGAVGDDLEGDFRTGKDAHLDLGLGADKAPEEALLLLFGEGYLPEDFRQDFRGKALIVGDFRNHEKAGHVGGAGTQGEVVLPFRVIMMRPVGRPAHHHGAVLPFAEKGQGVETGFGLPFRDVAAVQQAVEHFRHGLGRLRAEEEDTAGKMLIMEKLRVADRGDEGDVVFKVFRDLPPVDGDGMKQTASDAFHRHIPFRAGLEMRVTRDGGSAKRAVVEDDIVRKLDGEVQHVRIAVPDGLGNVDIAGDDQMVRENGGAVHQDAVFPSLPPLEGQKVLALHVILLAKGAAVVEDGHAAGVGLEGDEDAADGHLAGLGALEGPIFRRDDRPDGQLVMDEFIDVGCHTL